MIGIPGALPNIKAYFATGIGFQNAVAGWAASLHDETNAGNATLSATAKSPTRGFDFDASVFNPIYGASPIVAAASVVLKVWLRKA